MGYIWGIVLFNEMRYPKLKLNARTVDTSKAKDKAYKLSDGGGLYLLVNTNGSRYWRLKYRVAEKKSCWRWGYILMSLWQMPAKRDEAKRALAAGGDPGEVKQTEKQAKILAVSNSFEALAIEWHEHKRLTGHRAMPVTSGVPAKDVFPFIGKRAIAEIKAAEMLGAQKDGAARRSG